MHWKVLKFFLYLNLISNNFSFSWMFCLVTCQKWWSSKSSFSRLWKTGRDWFLIWRNWREWISLRYALILWNIQQKTSNRYLKTWQSLWITGCVTPFYRKSSSPSEALSCTMQTGLRSTVLSAPATPKSLRSSWRVSKCASEMQPSWRRKDAFRLPGLKALHKCMVYNEQSRTLSSKLVHPLPSGLDWMALFSAFTFSESTGYLPHC